MNGKEENDRRIDERSRIAQTPRSQRPGQLVQALLEMNKEHDRPSHKVSAARRRVNPHPECRSNGTRKEEKEDPRIRERRQGGSETWYRNHQAGTTALSMERDQIRHSNRCTREEQRTRVQVHFETDNGVATWRAPTTFAYSTDNKMSNSMTNTTISGIT